MVVCQVVDGVPTYEVKDEAGSMKTVHHNRLFLVATQKRPSRPWEKALQFQKKMLFGPPGQSIESDLPEGSMDGAETLSPASRVPLGWVGGVLRPLPSVVPRPTMWRGIGAGDGAESLSDEEVH